MYFIYYFAYIYCKPKFDFLINLFVNNHIINIFEIKYTCKILFIHNSFYFYNNINSNNTFIYYLLYLIKLIQGLNNKKKYPYKDIYYYYYINYIYNLITSNIIYNNIFKEVYKVILASIIITSNKDNLNNTNNIKKEKDN